MKALLASLCFLAASHVEAGPLIDLQTGWDANDPAAITVLFADDVRWRHAKLDKDALHAHWEDLVKRSPPSAFRVIEEYQVGNMWLGITTDEGNPSYMVLITDDDGLITGLFTGELDDVGFAGAGELGQSADIASTAVSLAGGAAELNPIMAGVLNAGGVPLLAAVKLGIVQALKHSGNYNMCSSGVAESTRMGWAAAAFNLGGLAGAGIGAIPAGIAAYVATDDHAWNSSQVECMEQSAKAYIHANAVYEQWVSSYDGENDV